MDIRLGETPNQAQQQTGIKPRWCRSQAWPKEKIKPSIKNIVQADGVWKNPDPKGKRKSAYIAIGKPVRDEAQEPGEWVCPIYIEHFTEKVFEARGIGPLDALLNATTLLRQFLDTQH